MTVMTLRTEKYEQNILLPLDNFVWIDNMTWVLFIIASFTTHSLNNTLVYY